MLDSQALVPGTPDAVARGLRDLRALRRRYWLASAVYVPLVAVVGGLWASLGPGRRWLATAATLAVAAGWLGLIDRLERRVAAARCPRCGGLFHARRWRMFELRGVFLRSCQHCGLRLRANHHPET